MLFAVFFAIWRFMEILTLLPTMGMLAWFVDGYNDANRLTPNYILILFIVSTLALAWAVFTLFSYHRSSHNARFVGFVDLAFVGALIAAIYYLRFIARADCAHVEVGGDYDVTFGLFGTTQTVTVSGERLDVNLNKTCSMLKACFAFAIMNCLFFFVTAIMAWVHGGHAAEKEKRYYQESHSRTTSRRRRSHSGSRHGGSRRSSHSHSRAYV